MRRLVPLGLTVTVLVALAGIASHGRPLAGGRGRGPTATFFDYVATTLVLFAVAMLALLVFTLFDQHVSGGPPRRGRWHLVSAFISFAGALLLSYVLLHSHFVQRLRRIEQELALRPRSGQTQPGVRKTPRNERNPHLRWDEIAIFVVLIGGATVVLIASRRTKREPSRWSVGRRRAVSLAIDESLDDLRADPDLRRAIVAAYARMESALGRAGMPRHPAEAPFEYVDRALRSLETSADSVHRLTALFEWAKFSQHEPEPEMRDEAVDALIAVRDELARPVEEPVTA
jgi:hypothetical protein